MPLTVPPFVQYQAPLVPLRALAGHEPPEGRRFISCEIDWLVTTPPTIRAVQVALSGNSPVAFSQIVSISVDNTRSGSDVQFVFTDSGFVLDIPGGDQGVFPVFTNALMFYVVASAPANTDITSFAVLNFLPPPVAVPQTEAQTLANASGISLAANASTPIIAAPTNGTVQVIDMSLNLAAAGSVTLSLVDGLANTIWTHVFGSGAGTSIVPFIVTGLRLRFKNGLNLVVSGTTMAAGNATVNIYYSVP